MDKNLPTSLNVIGWVDTAIGIIVVLTGLFLAAGIGLLSALFSKVVGIAAGIFVGVWVIVIGTLLVFLGQGILRKNKAAWVIGVVVAVLGVFAALSRRQGTDVVLLVWNVFIIWKLYEHRKLFGM